MRLAHVPGDRFRVEWVAMTTSAVLVAAPGLAMAKRLPTRLLELTCAALIAPAPRFNVLVINLNLDGSWGFAFATRTGSTVQGNLFAFDGTSVGTFTLTSATTFSGQSTIQGVTHTLSGTKLF
jgi:hypothetical protein